MNPLIEFLKLFGDETRLRILHLLNQQDLCVCEMQEILDLSQPKISKHIAKLRQNNVVKADKNEQYVYYSLSKEHQFFETLQAILKTTKEQLSIQTDSLNLGKIESFVCSRSAL
jgi:ArsR family transcriptional regulator